MNQGNLLPLELCPHCHVSKPHLHRAWGPVPSHDSGGGNKTAWSVYRCSSCGGMIMASSLNNQNYPVNKVWPEPAHIYKELPARAKDLLFQALASIHAPAGAVLLTANAIDAMLKEKGYREGGLCERIDAAAQHRLITEEMAAWARELRLGADYQRHVDAEAPLPAKADAEKTIEFAKALAQFLYVLPSQVDRGRYG